jgi:DNA-binding response OmpR family regulator
MKILIIDDDKSILDALTLTLEDAGYSIDTIYKGEQTYKKIESFRPHLILLDVLMSGKDGREICKNIKQNPNTQHIPIIMISAHPSAEKTIKECGANAFLAKPFDTEVLLKTIASYIPS